MKKIFYCFLPLLAVAILTGCGGRAGKDSFVIKGTLKGAKKDSIYLKELTTKSAVSIDSAVLTEMVISILKSSQKK